MQEMSQHDRPLPADRAFVVQLHLEADVRRGRIIGRAVHVVSGQATRFDSVEDLLMFIDQVLMRLPTEPPTELSDAP
jgi:hypothetical protein